MRKIFCACLCMLLCYYALSQRFNMMRTNYGSGTSPSNLTNVSGTLFFANNGRLSPPDEGIVYSGRELFKTNGTGSWYGTVLVKDINPGPASSNPSDFFAFGNILYFTADDGTHGRELWRSDGTDAGTYMVRDIIRGSASSNPVAMASHGSYLLFSAELPGLGTELWRTTGTASSTIPLKDIYPGAGSSAPSQFVRLGNKLYFSATDPDHGTELWTTDGTYAGTTLVQDIYPGAASSSPKYLKVANNQLFFRATHPQHIYTLMKSNGTDAGTVVVAPDADILMAREFEAIGNTIYFISYNDQLWRSNGTAVSTYMIKEISPGNAATSQILQLTPSNGLMFFRASDNLHGFELWKSDGTAAGTVMVKDILPGAASSGISNMTSIQNTLYFAAEVETPEYDYDEGIELWKSDGTTAGTVLAKDFNYRGDGYPSNFIQIGNKFFLTAIDSDYGAQLWVADLSASGSRPGLITEKEPGTPDESLSIRFYPNPAGATATLCINAIKAGQLGCTIADMNGKTVQQRNINVQKGNNTIPVETSLLPAGTYVLAVKGEEINEQIKFIIQ